MPDLHVQNISIDEIIHQINGLKHYISGHGIDIININSFSKIVKMAKDVCTTSYFSTAELISVEENSRKIERLAGKFALKEAVLKTFGVGLGNGISLTDVEVFNKHTGEPFIRLQRKLIQLEKSRGITEWFVTISHTDSIAIASAIAVSRIN